MLELLGNFFYNRLVTDPTLQALLPGTNWLYYFDAPPEAPTPRIVHMITEGGWSPENSQVEGRWDMSVYTFEATTAQNRTISDHIKRKLSNTVWFDTDGLDSIQLFLRPGSAFVGTGNYMVKRFDLAWDIRYSRRVQN